MQGSNLQNLFTKCKSGVSGHSMGGAPSFKPSVSSSLTSAFLCPWKYLFGIKEPASVESILGIWFLDIWLSLQNVSFLFSTHSCRKKEGERIENVWQGTHSPGSHSPREGPASFVHSMLQVQGMADQQAKQPGMCVGEESFTWG